MRRFHCSGLLFRLIPLALIVMLAGACQPGVNMTENSSAPTAQAVEESDPTPESTAPPVEEPDQSDDPTATPGDNAASEETETASATAIAEPEEDTAAEAEEVAARAAAAGGPRQFRIDPTRSEARFSVDEVLLGNDKTVVGVTSKITGALTVDPANPVDAAISTIQINARDLTTDSRRRNRSIQRQILKSALDDYEFITFEPTAVAGIPTQVAVGEPFTFEVTGNLTVVDTTRSETFTVTVTPESDTELRGLGTTTVLRDDYNLRIPRVPAVASVGEEVRLEIEFVATTE